MFPPGRARLAMSPSPTGSLDDCHDDGDRRGRLLGRSDHRIRSGHDDVHLEPHQLGRERGKPLVLSVREPALDHDVPALDVAELAQPLAETP